MKIFDFYSVYNLDTSIEVFVVHSLAEQCLDENDVLGTLVLHWYVCRINLS
jgi:hypothetical protein